MNRVKKMRLLYTLFVISLTIEAKKPRNNKPITPTERPRPPDSILNQYPELDLNVYHLPVPFGHIYKDGVEDPSDDFKRPIDLLELTKIYKDHVYKMKRDRNRMLPARPVTLSPFRNSYSQHLGKERMLVGERSIDDNKTIPHRLNIAQILKRNFEEPPRYRLGRGRRPGQKKEVVPKIEVSPPTSNKIELFLDNSFGVLRDKLNKTSNYTTCDEFGKRAKFHPNDIVNIEWVPFYAWTDDFDGKPAISHVHTFKFPSKKLVKRYKERYESAPNNSIDWEQPKLLFHQDNLESLLIARDRSGLFYALPSSVVNQQENRELNSIKPIMTVRLKIVDPYLAMMFCEDKYTIIMAVVDTEPRTYKKCVAEAAILKMKDRGLPMRRDFEMEASNARAVEMQEKLMEEQKFINVEDQFSGIFK